MGTNKTNNGAVKPFRIAVVGGAIGGLSTVMFLDHFLRTVQEPNPLPITIDVYEQASEYREIGNGIALGLNAAKLMHTVPGVAKALHEMKGNHQNAWFTFVRWDTGETIIHLDVPIKVDDEIRPVYIARSDYLDLLLGMIRDRGIATLHTKKKFVSVKVKVYNRYNPLSSFLRFGLTPPRREGPWLRRCPTVLPGWDNCRCGSCHRERWDPFRSPQTVCPGQYPIQRQDSLPWRGSDRSAPQGDVARQDLVRHVDGTTQTLSGLPHPQGPIPQYCRVYRQKGG